MLGKGPKPTEENVGHPTVLQVLPKPLDEVEIGTVVRKPKDLHVLLGILEVAMERLGVVRIALVDDQDDSPPGSPGAANQLLQKHSSPPGRASGLNVVEEVAASIAPGPENRQLAILAGSRNRQLSAAGHPAVGQVRMQMEFAGIGVPQFVVDAELQRPFFRRCSCRWALRKACSSRRPLSVCLGRR